MKTKKRNITLIFNHFEQEHWGKDVFLVPYYLGKLYNLNVTIAYPKTKTNHDFPAEIRGVRLSPVNKMFYKKQDLAAKISKKMGYFWYVISNAKKIDILMRIHLSGETILIGCVYKCLNSKGILYIKADGGEGVFADTPNSGLAPRFIRRLLSPVHLSFINRIDLITVETKPAYTAFMNNKAFVPALKQKIRLMNNGFDEEQFLHYIIRKNTFAEKENLIITVGRLGTPQKNSEMLLAAAARLDFKNWKLILIGPLKNKENDKEYDFQKEADKFYCTNRELTKKVICTGALYDKKELWQWYNRAKVFVLTSRWESWGLVLDEALFFRNYIISTNVGGAEDIVGQGYGEIIPQENPGHLAGVLQKIIDGDTKIEEQYQYVDWDAINNSWEKYIREATAGVF